MARDDQLRADSLVFYENDMQLLEGELDGFLELSGARCAMLIDKDGHLVTRRGESLNGSLDSISALVAGSFAATRELARLMGEDSFANMFHEGQRDSLQIQILAERTLFAIVFDDRTNLGLVRFYAQETARHLEAMLHSVAERDPEDQPKAELDGDFSQDAAAALDNLF